MLTTKRLDLVAEATTEVASLKKALPEAEHKAALERKERKKQEARVGEVQEELQELRKRLESAEQELKAKEAELAKALTNKRRQGRSREGTAGSPGGQKDSGG